MIPPTRLRLTTALACPGRATLVLFAGKDTRRPIARVRIDYAGELQLFDVDLSAQHAAAVAESGLSVSLTKAAEPVTLLVGADGDAWRDLLPSLRDPSPPG